MATEGDSFFSRWSRRKAENTVPVAKPAAVSPDAANAHPATQPAGSTDPTSADQAASAQAQAAGSPASDAPPTPTLEDVGKLTAESDFQPFVGRAVAPEVRNAAMKKLFTDPHFNVMDGLDIYIDDYSLPSPLPAELLKKMVSAQFMKLVEPEPEPVPVPTEGAAPSVEPPSALESVQESVQLAEPATPNPAADPTGAAEIQPIDPPQRPLHMTTLICNCNQTMPLDAAALGRALDEPLTVHRTLCRREAPAFQQAARRPDDLVVACTQESRLFTELAEQTEGALPLQARPIRFVNIRETGGWSKDAKAATPKIAALLAMARLPEPEPVPTVSYQSQGRLLVLGELEAAERVALLVADTLDVTLLATGGAGMQQRRFPVLAGDVKQLTGWLGAFTLRRETSNPIDLDLCTRCNACVAACPEGAIGLDYQVDMSRCQSHRSCVPQCEVAGAIHFGRAPTEHTDTFDLVLDLRTNPAFTQHAPPQGFWHVKPGADPATLMAAVLALRDAVGEFEKPKFFQYKASVCAHGRNARVGCDACVQVCSASAIESDLKRQQIRVNPHLCVGCGACTTVCPTGALSYAYPRAPDQGQKIKTGLTTYAKAGGKQAALLFHSQEAGAALIDDLGRAAMLDKAVRGVPARVIPMALHHTASVGLDVWLTALAQGASQMWVLMTAAEAPEYREAVQAQMDVAQALMTGLGYSGQHLRLLHVRDARDLAELDAALAAPAAQCVAQAASFGVQADKRATLNLALDHLIQHAPPAAPHRQQPSHAIALPAASPWGNVAINTDACTLCLSCVSACPASALQDNPDRPQLRFIEKNCVQCGLCATTCPENAIALQPRLWVDAQRGSARVINEAQPYQCVRCSKPFGTAKGIEAMLGRLGGHAMFKGDALERLKMCGDCRVVDIYSAPNEIRITDL